MDKTAYLAYLIQPVFSIFRFAVHVIGLLHCNTIHISELSNLTDFLLVMKPENRPLCLMTLFFNNLAVSDFHLTSGRVLLEYLKQLCIISYTLAST